jgi:hypothetical protein
MTDSPGSAGGQAFPWFKCGCGYQGNFATHGKPSGQWCNQLATLVAEPAPQPPPAGQHTSTCIQHGNWWSCAPECPARNQPQDEPAEPPSGPDPVQAEALARERASVALGYEQCQCEALAANKRPCTHCRVSRAFAESEREAAALRERLNADNAVCLCGCPDGDHESYGEDGESCANEDHQCLRVAVGVQQVFAALRERLALADAAWQRVFTAVDKAMDTRDLIHVLDAIRHYREGRRAGQGHD